MFTKLLLYKLAQCHQDTISTDNTFSVTYYCLKSLLQSKDWCNVRQYRDITMYIGSKFLAFPLCTYKYSLNKHQTFRKSFSFATVYNSFYDKGLCHNHSSKLIRVCGQVVH